MDLAFWSDVSIIWLTFLCFIGLLVALVASIFVVKGMHSVVDRTPRLMRQAQGYSRLVRTKVDQASVQVTTPVIQVHSRSRRYSTFLSRLVGRPAPPMRGETKK